jgi:hypothetical protein
MTARRQENKGRRFWPGRQEQVMAAQSVEGVARRLGIVGLLMLAALFIAMNAGPLHAAFTERVVSDWHTGLAIGGYDPVAYFTDAKALPGEPALEAEQGGAIWRFRNADNRRFFLARPDIYAPQFGGYDPVDLARGAIVAGRPQLWLVSGGRLYLFSREDNRNAFAAEPGRLAAEAADRWPALSATLADY